MQQVAELYTTMSRDFEQFLFAHDVFFVRSYRTADGATAWQYENTPYLQGILKEWQEILEQRRLRQKICGRARPYHKAAK